MNGHESSFGRCFERQSLLGQGAPQLLQGVRANAVELADFRLRELGHLFQMMDTRAGQGALRRL
jgi:hypothetical protein